MVAMLSRVVTEHPTIQIIEQKFLKPGNTHLDCDSDHVPTERAKKSTNIEIRDPQDWYLYVQSVRTKTPLKAVEMKSEDFLSFSVLYQKCQMKKNMDPARQKFSWFWIHYIRYEKVFGVFLFTNSIDENEPFHTLDAQRCSRGRPSKLTAEIPATYSTSFPTHPLKKRDLLAH
jgi:hypothetical protein